MNNLNRMLDRMKHPSVRLPTFVSYGEMMKTKPPISSNALALPLGVKANRRAHWVDMTTSPHLLIAEPTGINRHNLIDGILTTIASDYARAELRLVMIDTDTSLAHWHDLPHILAIDDVLDIPIDSIFHRFALIEQSHKRNLAAYNAMLPASERLPWIVVVISEFQSFEDTEALTRLVATGRSAGVFVVICTQSDYQKGVPARIRTNCATWARPDSSFPNRYFIHQSMEFWNMQVPTVYTDDMMRAKRVAMHRDYGF